MSAPPDPSSFTFEPLFAVLGLVATVVYVRAARIHRPGGCGSPRSPPASR